MLRLLILLVFSSVCFANQPLILGLDADMSAVAKEGGIAIQRGAKIAISEINQNGGLLGRKVSLEVKDHRGNPARGMANMKSFIANPNLVAVLGGVHTPVALQELKIIHENKVIYLDPWAAGTPIVDNGYEPNFVFRVSVRDEQAGKVLMSYAKTKNLNNVGLLLEKTGWGRSNEKSMNKAAKELGLTISDIQWFNWGQKELKNEINQLLEAGAQAIILVANAPEGAVAAKTILALNKQKRVPIISHWGIAGGNFVNQVGLEALSLLDIAVLQTYSFASPYNKALNKELLGSYRKMFDEDITAESVPGAVGTAHAYDLVHLLAKAIETCQCLESEKVRDALENINSHKGLVKTYAPPFTKDRHDALWADDYIMSHYNSQGMLVPINQ